MTSDKLNELARARDNADFMLSVASAHGYTPGAPSQDDEGVTIDERISYENWLDMLNAQPDPERVEYAAAFAARFNAQQADWRAQYEAQSTPQPRTLTAADLEKPVDPAIFTKRGAVTRSRHHYGTSDK